MYARAFFYPRVLFCFPPSVTFNCDGRGIRSAEADLLHTVTNSLKIDLLAATSEMLKGEKLNGNVLTTYNLFTVFSFKLSSLNERH